MTTSLLARLCGEPLLVVLEGEHVVATPLHDLPRDGRVRAHGIDGDDAAVQRKHLQDTGEISGAESSCSIALKLNDKVTRAVGLQNRAYQFPDTLPNPRSG